MEYIKEIPAIKWKNGNYVKVLEQTVNDENIFLYIDDLEHRKFSTYPKEKKTVLPLMIIVKVKNIPTKV